MADQNRKKLTGRDGLLGWIDLDEQPVNRNEALVRLENGTAVHIPAEFVVKEIDGSFYVPMSRNQFLSMDTPKTGQNQPSIVVIPVIAEEVDVSKRQVTSGQVKIAKHVREREETIDVPTTHQEVQVERVPVDRLVETPPQVRYEGDTMIIPVIEEILVVEKKLRLIEEVRVTRVQTETRDPIQVKLRTEEVDVNRFDPGEHKSKE